MDERLLCVILEMDRYMPHGDRLPENTPRPEWCRQFCLLMGCGEDAPCCGMYLDLSPVTFAIFQKLYQP